MKKHEPTGVGEIIDALKRTTRLGEQLEQARIWEHWPKLVGAKLAAHGRPQAVREGALRVEVDSAVWMHRYSHWKWQIIKNINRMARKELVSDMFFVLLPDGECLDDEV